MPGKPQRRPSSALVTHRERQRARGLRRLEVQVAADDVALVRAVAAALADPERADGARAVLRARFLATPLPGLKTLLAAAPLDGIDLARPRDTGRAVEL